MPTRLAALAVALLALAACAASPVAGGQPGSTVHSIDSGGVQRSYRLYLPADLASPAPLVVMLHGGFGSAEQAESSYGWDQLANTQKFVVAYPDGLGRAWNAGGCCGRPARDGVDDVAFITAAVRDVAQYADIDPARVYATGMSNGGIMSYALACGSTVFAAIGPVAATQLSCASPHPTSVLHIHGSADSRVRYDGGRGEGAAHVDGPPIPDVNAFWRNADGCSAPVSTTSGPVATVAADCADGRAVTLITVEGAGHQWPGSQFSAAQRAMGADPPSDALDATDTLWRFFAGHPRRG